MTRYKTYDYRHRALLPVSLEDQFMAGTLEFAIHTLSEKLQKKAELIDHCHIAPMRSGALGNLQSLGHEPDYFTGKILTAGSNYHTQVNLRECQPL